MKGKKGKKAKAKALKALPAPDRRHDPSLLDTSRIHWQQGDWADLVRITVADLTDHPDRGRLALIVAAAHTQIGNAATARQFTRLALDWGSSTAVVAQVLISSAHNTLARAATCLEDSAASGHFSAALRLVEPSADLALLSRSRQIRETTRLGLLPDAAALLAMDVAMLAKTPAENSEHLAMLDRRLTDLTQALAQQSDLSSGTWIGIKRP